MLLVVPQKVLIRFGFCRTAGGIVGADRDGIRRDIGTTRNIRIHRIVQPIVDHGPGKGVVRPTAAHSDACGDGRRDLLGGQEALGISRFDIRIHPAADAGIQVVLDIRHGDAAAHGCTAAGGHIGIDAARDLEVALIGRQLDSGLVVSRNAGNGILLGESLHILVDEVDGNRCAAREVVAGLAVLGQGQTCPHCHGSAAGKGRDVHALEALDRAVLYGRFDDIVNLVDAHGPAEGRTRPAALTPARRDGRTAAEGTDKSSIPGTCLQDAVIVQIDMCPVDDGLRRIADEVQRHTASPGKGKGRSRLGFCWHSTLRPALGCSGPIDGADDILYLFRDVIDLSVDGIRETRQLAEAVAELVKRPFVRFWFFGILTAGRHAAGHTDGVDEAGGLRAHAQLGSLDAAAFFIIIGCIDVLHRRPVDHIHLVDGRRNAGSSRTTSCRERQDGIVHIRIVIASDGNAALMVLACIFNGLQDSVFVHEGLILAVRIGHGQHAADGAALRLARREHDARMEDDRAAHKLHITGRQGCALIDLDKCIRIEILVIHAAADADAADCLRIILPDFVLAGDVDVLDGFFGLQVQRIPRRQRRMLADRHMAAVVEVSRRDRRGQGCLSVTAASRDSSCRDIGILIRLRESHGIRDDGQSICDHFTKRRGHILQLPHRLLDFRDSIEDFPACPGDVADLVQRALCRQVLDIGCILQIVRRKGCSHSRHGCLQLLQLLQDLLALPHLGFRHVLNGSNRRIELLNAAVNLAFHAFRAVVFHDIAALEVQVAVGLQRGVLIIRSVCHRDIGLIVHAGIDDACCDGHGIRAIVAVLERARGSRSRHHRIVDLRFRLGRQFLPGLDESLAADIHFSLVGFIRHRHGSTGRERLAKRCAQGNVGISAVLLKLAQDAGDDLVLLDFIADAREVCRLHGFRLQFPHTQVVVAHMGVLIRSICRLDRDIVFCVDRSLHIYGTRARVDHYIHGSRAHCLIGSFGRGRGVELMDRVRRDRSRALLRLCRPVEIDRGIILVVRNGHSSCQRGRTCPKRTLLDRRAGGMIHS